MKQILSFLLVGMLLATVASPAQAHGPRWSNRMAAYHSQFSPWHGNYANTQYGGPVALVVPPTASSMTALSWGVAQSEVRPLYQQYGRGWTPGAPGSSYNPYRPTPHWPSHTDQFGIYPVRGPWR